MFRALLGCLRCPTETSDGTIETMTDAALVISFDIAPADYRVLISQTCSTRRLPNPTWVKASMGALWVLNALVFCVFFSRRPDALNGSLMFAAMLIPVAVNILASWARGSV